MSSRHRKMEIQVQVEFQSLPVEGKKRVNILVNSCIREVDRIRMSE